MGESPAISTDWCVCERVLSHMSDSCHTYEWVMSYMGISPAISTDRQVCWYLNTEIYLDVISILWGICMQRIFSRHFYGLSGVLVYLNTELYIDVIYIPWGICTQCIFSRHFYALPGVLVFVLWVMYRHYADMLSYTHTEYTYTEAYAHNVFSPAIPTHIMQICWVIHIQNTHTLRIYSLLALPLPPFLQSFRCVCEKDVPVRCESIRSRMRSELRCLDLQV